MRIPMKAPYQLFKTQLEDLKLLCQYNRFANFSEMGAGKTLPSALLSLGVIEDNLCDYAIIVTPKIVMGDWHKVFKNQLDIDHQSLVGVYHAPTILRPFIKLKPIVIMSYNTFIADKVRWLELARNKRIMWTFDEAHWIRNVESGRGALAQVLCALAKRAYLLTGSPLPNGLKAAYAYINIMEPGEHYTSFKHFQLRHMVFNNRKLVYYRNVDSVTEIMNAWSVRHLKKEILDLPPVTFTTRDIPWDRDQLIAYKELQRSSILELKDSWLHPLGAGALATRLHQITTNPRLVGVDADSKKFDYLKQDLESIDLSKHKVVVYAHYRGTIDRLRKEYQQYNPAAIYGKITDSEGQKEKFLEDDTCRIMFANPISAGIGVNFTISSYFIFFEYSYDLDSYDQAVSRGNRPGQTEPLTVINYAVRGSMEIRKILPRLVEKKNFSMTVLQDPEEFIEFISLDEDEDLLDD